MKIKIDSRKDLEEKRKWLKDNPMLASDTLIIREGQEEDNFIKYGFASGKSNALSEDIDDEVEYFDDYNEFAEDEELSLAEEASALMFFSYIKKMKERGIDTASDEADEEMLKMLSDLNDFFS